MINFQAPLLAINNIYGRTFIVIDQFTEIPLQHRDVGSDIATLEATNS